MQVFSSFASPELNPLLLRLDKDATVASAIEGALGKYLQHQPLAALPSDMSSDYRMCVAGGDGYPARGAQPFLANSILRNLAGLEFPYMLHVSYHPAAAVVATSGTSADGSGVDDYSAASGKERAPLWGSYSHKTLSAVEKEALDRRRKEVERKREENLAAIERRRVDAERNAYQHAESYEVYRQERLKNELEQQERQRLMQEAKDAALRAAQGSSGAHGSGDGEGGNAEEEDAAAQSKRILNQHRIEMQRKVEEDKQRAIEVARYREQRQREQEEKRLQLQREKQRLLKEQQGARMQNAMEEILGKLDSKVMTELDRTQQQLSESRALRKELERTEADLRSIATLETTRNEPKIASRAHRSEAAEQTLRLQQQSLSQQGQADNSNADEVKEQYAHWRREQNDKQATLESHLELHYRTVFDSSGHSSPNRPL